MMWRQISPTAALPPPPHARILTPHPTPATGFGPANLGGIPSARIARPALEARQASVVLEFSRGLKHPAPGRRPAAPRSPEPQRRRINFLPLGFAHSSRGKKVSPPPSSVKTHRIVTP